MNSKNYSLYLNKFILSFVFLLFSFTLFSQSKKIILDEQGIQKVISINTKKGLPHYEGIYSEYTFSVDQLKEASADQGLFISYIKKYAPVTECILDVQNLKVIVTTKTDNPKTNDINDTNVAQLKAILADHNVKMTNYKKIVYCKN